MLISFARKQDTRGNMLLLTNSTGDLKLLRMKETSPTRRNWERGGSLMHQIDHDGMDVCRSIKIGAYWEVVLLEPTPDNIRRICPKCVRKIQEHPVFAEKAERFIDVALAYS
jgi:hypothetical protein